MKILTVKQPWAHLIIHGGKRIENRTWKTEYRGPVAIHAGKTKDTSERGWKLAEVRDEETGEVWVPEMEYGKIIGVARLVSVWDLESAHKLTDQSKWVEGPYCWVFRQVSAIPHPIPYKGALGLRDLPTDFITYYEYLAEFADGR